MMLFCPIGLTGRGNVCRCVHTHHARRHAADLLQLLQLLCMSLPGLQVSYHTHIPEYIPKYTWKGLVGPMWRVIRFNILMADLTLVPSNTMKVPHSPMQCSCWHWSKFQCSPSTRWSLTIRFVEVYLYIVMSAAHRTLALWALEMCRASKAHLIPP